MKIITENSEQVLAELLQRVQSNPEEWLSLHINIAARNNQILRQEGLSRKLLLQIHAISMDLAVKLNQAGLEKCEGEILVFEDSDILALLNKKAFSGLDAIINNVRREFVKSQMDYLLVIEEMREKLAQLVVFSEEKKKTAADYRKKRRAVEIGENPTAFSETDMELLRAIHEKRRGYEKGCVLVIEDDVMVRGLIASMLHVKYDVIQAKDAISGITAYIDSSPHIVFLDIHMPLISGHDTLISLKKIDPAVYAVMLSGDSTRDNVLSAKTEGAKGFLGKPFPQDTLLEHVKRALAVQTAQAEDTMRGLGSAFLKDPFRI